MLEVTLNVWMTRRSEFVEGGEVEAVRIMGKRPTLTTDFHSPEGGFGWQFGWRWQDLETGTGSSTIPEEIFRHLPDCPCPGVVIRRSEGSGVRPRWPTESEALAALDQAAMAWAKSQVGVGG